MDISQKFSQQEMKENLYTRNGDLGDELSVMKAKKRGILQEIEEMKRLKRIGLEAYLRENIPEKKGSFNKSGKSGKGGLIHINDNVQSNSARKQLSQKSGKGGLIHIDGNVQSNNARKLLSQKFEMVGISENEQKNSPNFGVLKSDQKLFNRKKSNLEDYRQVLKNNFEHNEAIENGKNYDYNPRRKPKIYDS